MGGNVQIRNIADGTLSRVLENDVGIDLMGFSQDEKYLATVTSTGIGQWLVSSGSWFPAHWDTTEEWTSIAYNPVFDKVAVGFTDGVIRIYDFQSNLLETWGTAQSGKAIRRLEYCPKASFLAVSYEDGSLVIWKETGGEPQVDISLADAGMIASMTYSASCDTLLLVGEDGRLRYLTYDSGGIADLALPGEISSIASMEFSPDETILAIATREYEIILLDFEKMEILNVLKGHTKDITSLIFVHGEGPLFNFDGDTSLLVSTSMDGTTRLWGVGD
jgi:WD40 repeat protein